MSSSSAVQGRHRTLKKGLFITAGSGRGDSKGCQTPARWVSHHRSGQGKVMPGANPSGCLHSPIQAGTALSPGLCHRQKSHSLRHFLLGVCGSFKNRIYSLPGARASPPAPGLLLCCTSVPWDAGSRTRTPRCLQSWGRKQRACGPEPVAEATGGPISPLCTSPFPPWCITLWQRIPSCSWASP